MHHSLELELGLLLSSSELQLKHWKYFSIAAVYLMKDQILIKGMMAEGTKVLPRQYTVTRYYMNTMTRH